MEENKIRKILIIFTLCLSALTLNGCQSSHNFDFEIPQFDDYQLNAITFNDYSNSTIDTFENIDSDSILNATQSNIYITNVSYNNEWWFSPTNNYSGSGVIFHETDDYYYALTNAHVVEKHRDYSYNLIEILDYFDNKYSGFIYEGSLNTELDLAIVVFEKDDITLPVSEIVDWEISIGLGIIAIGNPLGERNIITTGSVIKYNKTRTIDRYGETKTNEFYSIIHSAETNSGSSGGMLLNFDLKIVGINYAGNHDEDNPEGFSIPSNMVVDYIQALIEQ